MDEANVPVLHEVQPVAPGAPLNDPRVHCMQALAPLEPTKLPAGHAVQLAAPPTLMVPAEHDEHDCDASPLAN